MITILSGFPSVKQNYQIFFYSQGRIFSSPGEESREICSRRASSVSQPGGLFSNPGIRNSPPQNPLSQRDEDRQDPRYDLKKGKKRWAEARRKGGSKNLSPESSPESIINYYAPVRVKVHGVCLAA
ncbi:MAG: hypothetical protein ACYTAO_19715 [Planctomycetota bacterium]